MACQHAGRGDGRTGCGDRHRLADGRFDRLAWQGAGAQLHDAVAGDGKDGRLHPRLAGAAIEHRDATGKAAAHLFGRGRGEFSRRIGGGRSQRPAGGADQGQRQRVVGNADADGVEPGSDQVGEPCPGSALQHERQRAGPEARQLAGQRRELDQRFGHGEIGDMDDQRIEARPTLGLVDGEHCIGTGGVRAEAINRLGGKGDEAAGP